MPSIWLSSISAVHNLYMLIVLCHCFRLHLSLSVQAHPGSKVRVFYSSTMNSDWCLTLSPHRLVLSSVSDYFAAMFTSDVREAKQDEVKLEGIDPDALWVLVQYAYTGKEKHCLPLTKTWKKQSIHALRLLNFLLSNPTWLDCCLISKSVKLNCIACPFTKSSIVVASVLCLHIQMQYIYY